MTRRKSYWKYRQNKNRRGSHARAYISWFNMKQRCTNINNAHYKEYGGRGITYDPRWDSFENFLEDMGDRPIGFSLERKDNDGHYCKDNCKWATALEQRNNRRDCI